MTTQERLQAISHELTEKDLTLLEQARQIHALTRQVETLGRRLQELEENLDQRIRNGANDAICSHPLTDPERSR
jgi:chaperonin cofactor prefoldin